MKIFFILMALSIITSASNLYSQQKTSIAVLELDAGGISQYEAQVLTNRLRTELFKTNKFNVLERDKMDEILIEQGFQMSCCISTECAVEVGKLTGVEQMVAGNVAKIDDLFTIDIRLIDVETGKVVKTATEDCECQLKDVLTRSIGNVSKQLAGLKVSPTESSIKFYKQPDRPLKFEDHSDYKSPTKAMIFSMVIPGTGQYYNGDIFKGVAQQVIIFGSFYVGINYGNHTYTDDNGEEHLGNLNAIGFISIGAIASTWLWSWLDARASAVENNKQLEQQFGHLYQINHNSTVYGLDIGLNKDIASGQLTIHF